MSTLLSMLRQPRYEVIPARSAEQAVADHIPPGSTVAVTASAAKGLDATLGLAERLAARGYRVVPHLAARSMRDETHLKEIVERLTAAGVDDVFVPGGDSKEPAGCFDGALPLLERLTQMSNPFRYVGTRGVMLPLYVGLSGPRNAHACSGSPPSQARPSPSGSWLGTRRGRCGSACRAAITPDGSGNGSASSARAVVS